MWIKKAEILRDFIIGVWFEDKYMIIDLEPELRKGIWYYIPFRNIETFKKEFMVEYGTIAWGESWDLHFENSDIYEGKIGVVISEKPIPLSWTVAEYAKYFGLTKQAIFKRIWNNKMPDNVRAEKNKDNSYKLLINYVN
jgi:hypothetical protein